MTAADEARAEALDLEAIKARIEGAGGANLDGPWTTVVALALVAPALVAEVERLTAQLQAAQAKLAAIRSIGAHSGTDINAWNKAFDVLDDADLSTMAEHDKHVAAKALKDAAIAYPFLSASAGFTMDWLAARATSIEQTEANRG